VVEAELIEEEEYGDDIAVAFAADDCHGGGGRLGCGGALIALSAFMLMLIPLTAAYSR
jgi:hypothetical protein